MPRRKAARYVLALTNDLEERENDDDEYRRRYHDFDQAEAGLRPWRRRYHGPSSARRPAFLFAFSAFGGTFPEYAAMTFSAPM
ncbi:MAG: hypothetical protein NVSMB5_04940 [Candidatus Velthaea sp.]